VTTPPPSPPPSPPSPPSPLHTLTLFDKHTYTQTHVNTHTHTLQSPCYHTPTSWTESSIDILSCWRSAGGPMAPVDGISDNVSCRLLLSVTRWFKSPRRCYHVVAEFIALPCLYPSISEIHTNKPTRTVLTTFWPFILTLSCRARTPSSSVTNASWTVNEPRHRWIVD